MGRKHRRLYSARATTVKISKSVWDHIMPTFFMKNWSRILIPHHMKHILTPSPPHAFLEMNLGKFSPSVVYGNACSNLNYSNVSHPKLFARLYSYGIRGTVLTWLKISLVLASTRLRLELLCLIQPCCVAASCKGVALAHLCFWCT